MKVLLNGPDGIQTHIAVDTEVLQDRAIIVYNGVHYLFAGFEGRSFTTVRFDAVSAPLEVAVQPQPPALRKFMGMEGE